MASVAFATSSAVVCTSRAVTCTRGVITFSAVRSARFRVRTNSSAVSFSKAPAFAECRARATSSCGVRAEASSSVGSMPKRRTMWFAVVLRWLIRGLKARLKTRCIVATRLAIASGEEMAQFLGTSSPTTIRTTVETAVPRIRAAEEAVSADRPMASNGPWSRAEIDGLEIMPMTRPVTVMPSWAPESWNVRVRTAARALSAPRSPRSTARSSSLRSTVVSENSAATKAPQVMQSSSATTRRSTSVIGRSPPSHDRPGGGGPRDVANG